MLVSRMHFQLCACLQTLPCIRMCVLYRNLAVSSMSTGPTALQMDEELLRKSIVCSAFCCRLIILEKKASRYNMILVTGQGCFRLHVCMPPDHYRHCISLLGKICLFKWSNPSLGSHDDKMLGLLSADHNNQLSDASLETFI
jgi:hypothetical protein